MATNPINNWKCLQFVIWYLALAIYAWMKWSVLPCIRREDEWITNGVIHHGKTPSLPLSIGKRHP